MYKYICILLLLVSSFNCFADDISVTATKKYIKLASWNIRILSDKSRTDQELTAICKIAKNFDLVVIEELRDEKVIQRMVAIMKDQFARKYTYKVSSAVGSSTHKELYGFFYNAEVVKCLDTPKIYNDSFFARKPCVASFKAGKFDFTIICVHIIWGSTVTQRRKEIQRMANIFRKVQDRTTRENDVILVGDFNRDPDDDLAWGPIKSIPGMTQVFQLPSKSMIKDTHCYDNILFQSMYLNEWTGYQKIYHFDETDFANDDKKASEWVSDHRPVAVRFRTTQDDD